MPVVCIAGWICNLKCFLNQQQQERPKFLPNLQPFEYQSVQGKDNVVGFQEYHKISNPQ